MPVTSGLAALLGLLVACRPGPPLTPPLPAAPPPAATRAETARDPRAVALVAALEAYHNSVRSFECEQSLFQAPAPGRWLRSDSRHIGFDDLGRWFVRSEYSTADREAGTLGVTRGYRFYDGERLFGMDPVLMRGVVKDDDNDNHYVTSPPHLLGRYVDYEHWRPLHAFLGDAESLAYEPPSAAEPWPLVRAQVRLFGAPHTVEVRVDPVHGFSPRRIRLMAPLGDPQMVLETLRYTEVSGVHLPSVGLSHHYIRWMIERRSEELARVEADRPNWPLAADLSGPLGALDEATRAQISEAVLRLRVSGPCPREPSVVYAPAGAADSVGAYGPNVMVCNYSMANRPLPPEAFWLPMPPGKEIYDGYRARRSTFDQARPYPDLVPARPARHDPTAPDDSPTPGAGS
ncbi:MAG TPA: hypothetical protein VD963_02065 [Phycisphaerales bacterium]|nr:hypothetical protein [Phycisphaerales bacterium]